MSFPVLVPEDSRGFTGFFKEKEGLFIGFPFHAREGL
jgi:hypothetical protein